MPGSTQESRPGFSALSAAQQRLWFFWQLRPDSSDYHVPKATRLRGPLELPALERAVTRLAERHSLLRATFPLRDGAPVLRIPAATAPVPLPVTDLTDLPEPAREQALAEAVDRLALAPFDLREGPLFRAGLVRLAPQEHVLVLSFHHIVVDGWSLGIVERDLAEDYAAALDGTLSPPRYPNPRMTTGTTRLPSVRRRPPSAAPSQWPTGGASWMAPPTPLSCPLTGRTPKWRAVPAAPVGSVCRPNSPNRQASWPSRGGSPGSWYC